MSCRFSVVGFQGFQQAIESGGFLGIVGLGTRRFDEPPGLRDVAGAGVREGQALVIAVGVLAVEVLDPVELGDGFAVAAGAHECDGEFEVEIVGRSFMTKISSAGRRLPATCVLPAATRVTW